MDERKRRKNDNFGLGQHHEYITVCAKGNGSKFINLDEKDTT